MNRIERAIFPGLFCGCILIILFAGLVTSPKVVEAYNATGQVTNKLHTPNGFPHSAGDFTQVDRKDGTVSLTQVPTVKKTKKPKPTRAPVKKTSQEKSNPNECPLNNQVNPAVRQWCKWIDQYARENNLDPRLIAAVITQESAGQPQAYSASGAVGLMQIMPRDGLAASFMCINGPCFASRPTISELSDPEFNISYGSRMLAGLVQKYGSPREALQFYGPANVGYTYADIVLSIYSSYQ
jgi:hypothetical protein